MVTTKRPDCPITDYEREGERIARENGGNITAEELAFSRDWELIGGFYFRVPSPDIGDGRPLYWNKKTGDVYAKRTRHD